MGKDVTEKRFFLKSLLLKKSNIYVASDNHHFYAKYLCTCYWQWDPSFMQKIRRALRTHEIYITFLFYLFSIQELPERKETIFISCLPIFAQKMMSSHQIIYFIVKYMYIYTVWTLLKAVRRPICYCHYRWPRVFNG